MFCVGFWLSSVATLPPVRDEAAHGWGTHADMVALLNGWGHPAHSEMLATRRRHTRGGHRWTTSELISFRSSWSENMQADPKLLSVRDVIELKRNGMLAVNPEYQRGSVWQPDQQKRLIDSLFREYPLPLIYLHHIHNEVGGFSRDGLDVIDGQQRINALFRFSEGGFRLFDPAKDAAVARFPAFIKDQPCEWGGKTFEELSPELKRRFQDTPLSVVYIKTDFANEARDLFIRLQAGLPLNAQEKRDAWPGKFTEFVLKLGGKPELDKYPGHDFFAKAMKTKPNGRGEVRQLTAQMLMLYMTRRKDGNYCGIKREAVDDFYYQHLDFDSESDEAKRFDKLLTLLNTSLGLRKRKKIQGHEAISLLLLADSLMDDYVTASWETKFDEAFDCFREKLAYGSKTRWQAQPDEYWLRYGLLARTNSDRAEIIERRHSFFVSKMLDELQPKLKDPVRVFGEAERELIFYRDSKRCQVCDQPAVWNDIEIHHVTEHHSGGATILSNGALVHKSCHPRSEDAVRDFASAWASKVASNPVLYA